MALGYPINHKENDIAFKVLHFPFIICQALMPHPLLVSDIESKPATAVFYAYTF